MQKPDIYIFIHTHTHKASLISRVTFDRARIWDFTLVSSIYHIHQKESEMEINYELMVMQSLLKVGNPLYLFAIHATYRRYF